MHRISQFVIDFLCKHDRFRYGNVGTARVRYFPIGHSELYRLLLISPRAAIIKDRANKLPETFTAAGVGVGVGVGVINIRN